ncbi:MAG: hypothetical protein IJH31_00950 [Erysipelotrichaceae bacterium]|nr:hypothetical protein [Erysipelotrichaceae bacterium]
MNDEELLNNLLEEGYSKEEVLEIIEAYDTEKEHLDFYRFIELHYHIND